MNTKKICLTILVGLPGVGKTTFCHNILGYSFNYNFTTVHISYDDFIKINFVNCEKKEYKIQRKLMLQNIENCIKMIQESNKILIEFEKYSKFNENCNNYIILIDDNNYYRGMRYEFFQLARKLKISFAQIYFKYNLNYAIQQNSLRNKNCIPKNVIEKMNERFEEPLVKNGWEKNTFIIENGQVINYERIFKFLESCLQIHEEVNFSIKNSFHQSEIHEIDLKLRKLINNHLKTIKKQEDKIKIANELNKKKKS